MNTPRVRMDASKNAFAKRMMGKPASPSLDSNPAARHFYDPPELIQISFGGREWFWANGINGVHRIGLFKGLGWELPGYLRSNTGITGVKITSRTKIDGAQQLFDMEFVHRGPPEGVSTPSNQRTVKHIPGLTAQELKPAYAKVLGDHAI